MNANQIKQLTLQAKNQLITEKEISWISLSKFVYDFIEKSALLGKSKVVLDLNSDYFILFKNKDFDFIKHKLEDEGFTVEYFLEKSPNGQRQIIISW